MIREKLYLFEVYISKCTISIKLGGQISLFLRIGKTISSFLKAKSYDNQGITFQSAIKCNCDQNALDTKRFSITLNIKDSDKENKVLGIVMIPLQQDRTDQLKTYKISQCLDAEATMEIKYSMSLIDGGSDSHKKFSDQKSNLTPKKAEDIKKTINKPNVLKVGGSQKRRLKGHYIQSFFSTPPMNRLTTSEFIQEAKMITKQEIQAPNPEQIFQLKENKQKLQKQNEKLRRQKQFLKELLKIQVRKNNVLQIFLQRTYKILAQKAISKSPNKTNSEKVKYQQKFEKLRQTINQADKTNKNPLCQSLDSIGQNLNIVPFPLTQKGQISKFQFGKCERNLGSDSKISFSKISCINQELSTLLKDSVIKERQDSKNTIQQLRKVLMDESELKHERRLRSVKIKVQKSYLQLFKQPQPYTKQQIIKQKINVNKILDQLLMCSITP